MSRALPLKDEAEVVVIGAGPAGSVAATTLARLGREVILIDQSAFPRDKSCGDALWGSAVLFLEKLELDHLVHASPPLEGLRLVRPHTARSFHRYTARPALKPLPRCIPRLQLDAALFETALASGARFVRGRVEQANRDGDCTETLEVRDRASRFAIRGRWFIAADGATSRLRRLTGIAPPASALRAEAIRQYFQTDRQLDQVLEMRIPLRHGGKLLPGYGWVFPVAEGVANIGVGFHRSADLAVGVSLRDALRAFIEELCSDSDGFGDLKGLGKPLGAPIAVGFSPTGCKAGNMLFVGDAARMTDPLLGEGISTALHSGEAAANEIDAAIKSGRLSAHFGRRLPSRFPRLGQDTAVLMRAYPRRVLSAKRQHTQADSPQADSPFLEGVLRLLVRNSDYDPTIRSTPAWLLTAELDEGTGTALREVGRLALETLRTEFPLALELAHRQFRRGAGPARAATLLLVESACGSQWNERSLQAALAIELLAMTASFLGQASQGASQSHEALGDGLATLVADHALSHSLRTMARVGVEEAAELAGAARTVFEGEMLEGDEAFRLDRPAERYLAAVQDRSATLYAAAALLGARLAGNDEEASVLGSYGSRLGMAMQIAEDVVELVAGDEVMATPAGTAIRHGTYSLPVIYALEEDSGLGEIVGSGVREDEMEEIVGRIRATAAVERSIAECERYAENAKAVLAQNGLSELRGLMALADLPVSYCVARSEDASAIAI